MATSAGRTIDQKGSAEALSTIEDSDMRSVLVVVHDDEGETSRLQSAIDLARALHGHLDCLELYIPPLPPYEPGFNLARAETIGADSALKAHRLVAASGVGFAWHKAAGDLACVTRTAASAADIVVLSTPGHLLYSDMRTAIGTTLVNSDKPILAVPVGTPGLRVNGEALILWDGSKQAVSAMHAAMPLLRQARSVTLLEVDDGSLATPAREAAAHLDARNITARVRTDLAFGEKAGFVILEQIKLLKPDYIVMGGFGHARFIEGIFGGVTERLLRDSPVPLFLKH